MKLLIQIKKNIIKFSLFSVFRSHPGTEKMENNIYEDPDCTVMSRQQNRLRAALTKLSDVCQRNSKLTEAVLSKPKVAGNTNSKQRITATSPPTPPLRTVSLLKIKTQTRIEARPEAGVGSDYKQRKSPERDHLEDREENVRKDGEADPVLICESSARVRRSLENLSVPRWFTKYKQNSNRNINKWTRSRTEVGRGAGRTEHDRRQDLALILFCHF